MTTRSLKYKDATKAYIEANKPSFGFETELSDISVFMSNNTDWTAALELISASNRPIQVGFAEGLYSDVGYFLGQDGWYAVFVKDGKEERLDPPNASDLAKAFRKQNPKEPFLDFIYRKLDELVDACPKPKE